MAPSPLFVVSVPRTSAKWAAKSINMRPGSAKSLKYEPGVSRDRGGDALCDPQAAAARLASPDWQWTPDRLSALALASLISIAVSIIPLLVALYLMSKKLRAAIKGGEPAPEVGVPWVKRPEARALLLSTTFLVQILEDVPQSVIGSLFVSTMLAKAGANCDSCFFDNAPAGVAIDDPSCYVQAAAAFGTRPRYSIRTLSSPRSTR